MAGGQRDEGSNIYFNCELGSAWPADPGLEAATDEGVSQ